MSRLVTARKAIRRFALTVGFSAAPLLAGLATASASPPQFSEQHFSGTEALVDCGDFLVLDDFDLTATLRWFTDKNGNVVGGLRTWHGTDSVYNSVTGERYTARSGQAVKIDPTSGERTVTGVVFRVNVPGAGVVLLDVGRSIFDPATGEHTIVGGPHQLLEGDVEALCAALA